MQYLDESGNVLYEVNDSDKIFKMVNGKISGLAGVGQRGIVAGDDGRLGVTGGDFIFSSVPLTPTPVSTGININGGLGGKIVMAYLSGQWDAGNSSSAALIMIRCGHSGNNFSATVVSSDNYVYPVTFTQISGTLHVSAGVTHAVRIRFITN